MEIKNIYTDASWYASYMEDKQGVALIRCQAKKIEQLNSLLDNIIGEIELAKNPQEYDPMTILLSVEQLINQLPIIEHIEGYFKWNTTPTPIKQ